MKRRILTPLAGPGVSSSTVKRLSIPMLLAALTVTACDERGTPVAPTDDPLRASMAVVGYECTVQTEIPVTECDALVALYDASGGPAWADNTNWLATSGPCGWYGVVCFGGVVTQLGLNGNQLNGSIPPEIGDLGNLFYLGLGDNQLSGAIPPEFGNLGGLVRAHLFNNQLSGPIPPELGNLDNLMGVQAGGNQLSGPIPAELGNLANLTRLNLGYNQLSGAIPAELGNLGKLEVLHLQANHLSGAIPTELGNLGRLTELELYQNQLSGAIPTGLGNLTDLNDLVLGENQLSGAIPTELGNLTGLLRLELHMNQLSGPIPASLGNLGALQGLWLVDNQLSGLVPIEVARLGGSEPLSLHCAFVPGNDPLYMPDTQPYRDADLDGDGMICGLAFSHDIVVAIDIKPGTDSNPINPRSKGLVPVAILGSAGFDVADVDVTTLTFGPGGAAPVHEAGGHVEDLNHDGFDDLVSHYAVRDAGLSSGDTEACVDGATTGGTPIHGCDAVDVVR